MEYVQKLHPAQSSVLFTLRHATRARYSELQKPTGLAGDIFKYHLQKLVKAKYATKAEDGLYELTAEGKEYANHIDERTGKQIAQPKASMLLVVRAKIGDEIVYLAHRRARQPFRDFWGLASAPMLRGVPITQSAAKELRKQTGISADFQVAGLYRVIDRSPGGVILEDKLFSLMVADVEEMHEPHNWYGGESVWMTREALLGKKRLFPITSHAIDMIETGQRFAETECVYTTGEY